MNLVKALMGLGKGAANATGLPFLINTAITNPIKSIAADLTNNEEAYRNAERFYRKPVGDQLKQWGGASTAALLPFVGGAGIQSAGRYLVPQTLAQKSLFGAASGGLLGGALNVAGMVGQGGDATLRDFGQGALFGGAIGGATPLAGALWKTAQPHLTPLNENGFINITDNANGFPIRNNTGADFGPNPTLPINNRLGADMTKPFKVSDPYNQQGLKVTKGVSTMDDLTGAVQQSHLGKITSTGDKIVDSNPKTQIVRMSPDDYLKQAFEATDGKFGGSYDSWLSSNRHDPQIAKKYAEAMKKGDKFPTPFIDNARGMQDGRNRALAAKLAGKKTIDVAIVPKLTPSEEVLMYQTELNKATSPYMKFTLQQKLDIAKKEAGFDRFNGL